MPVGRRSQPPFLAPNGYELPPLKMTKLFLPPLRPKWAPDRVMPMPMAPPLVPSPVLRAARLRKVLLAVPGLGPAPVTLPVPDRATKPGPVAADLEAAPAQGPATLPALVPAAVAVEVAPVAVINPAPVLVTLTAPVVEAAPAAVVGTKTPFGGE